MKMNSLLSEIIRGQWLLDVSGDKAFTYSEMALKLLSGEKLDIEVDAEPKAILTLYDKNGQPLQEKQAIPNQAYGKVLIVGTLIKRGNYCYWGADEIVSRLDFLNDNPKIKGIVIEIDSPGGAVSAAGVFQNFAKRKKKPIVAICDQCYSLGYLAAVALADRIFADNEFSAGFGSIGVVSSFIAPTEEYYKDRKLKYHHIVPDESKDKNKAGLEAMKGNYDLIKKDILSPMAVKFQDLVRAKRPNLKEKDGVLNGRTYFTEEAQKLGLIDGVADLDKALYTLKFLETIN